MKKILLSILGILASLQISYAAIGFNSATTVTTSASASLTFSHTTSGSDRALIVVSAANGPSFTTTGVTYAGVSMTKISEKRDSGGAIQYMWYLANPASGANNVVITNSGSVTTGSAVSYTGVSQTGNPEVATTTGEESTTSFTTTLTTLTDQSWVVATSRTGSGAALTAGANTTIRSQSEVTYFGSGAIWDSNGGRSVGSNSLNVTSVSQLYGGGIMVALKPAGAAVSSSPTTLGFFKFAKRR